MSSFFRVTINWTGFPGGPGFTNLFFKSAGDVAVTQAIAQEAVTKVDAWLNTWQGDIPAVVTSRVDPNVVETNEQTGAQIGFFNTTSEAAQQGIGTGGYSAASGACINWYTNGALNGRRVRGRTFMVPLVASAFDTNGTLNDTRLALWRTNTQTLVNDVSDSSLQVWHRPTVAAPTSGSAHPVTSLTINDKAAILTSRRD
jgi:hypothetical protein